jgi:hypothetical protein
MLDAVTQPWTNMDIIGHRYDFILIVDFIYKTAQDELSTAVQYTACIL